MIIISYLGSIKKRKKQISISLRLISLNSALILVILLFFSWLSDWEPLIWTLTQYLGPILFLGIWTPFASSFLNIELDSISFKRTFPVMIFGSILVVFGALLLNTRIFIIILNGLVALFNLDLVDNDIGVFIINELLFGIIGPANEELIKIIPIIVILHSSIVFFNPEREDLMEFERKSSVMSFRQFGLYGIVSGTIFTFLELFLYQWQTIGGESSSEAIFLQILLRTLAPLHVWTTFIIALGIGSLKGRLAEQQDIKIAFLGCLGYFVLGWGFHALWNSLNVYFVVFLPDEELILYILLGALGVFIDFLLFIGIILVFRTEPEICNKCGYQELAPHSHFKQLPLEQDDNQPKRWNLRSTFNIILHLRRKAMSKKLSCPFCQTPLILGTCSTCGARTFVTCPHCNGFISETTSKCPHCSKRIKPLIEIRTNTLSLAETIIIGVSTLTNIAFLLAPLTILLFGQIEGLGGIIIPILIFYFIMSLITLVNVAITLFLNRTSGILVLFCLFLLYVILVFTILGGVVFIGILRAIIIRDLIGISILCLIGAVLCFIAYRFLQIFYFNYSPIFSEYNLETIQNPFLEEL